MQHDPRFAEGLRRREPAVVATTDLSPRELDWLCEADPARVRADRGGARRAQLLRNVGGELALTLSQLPAEALDTFPSSPEFHAAVRQDRSLPLALADHLARVAGQMAAPLEARALLALERALAVARRSLRPIRSTRGDEIVLAPWAHLCEVPEGTLDLAAELRSGACPPAGPAPGSGPTPHPERVETESLETLLIRAEPPSPFRLREVSVERLSGPLAELLSRARAPLSRSDRAHYARSIEAEPAELEAIVAEMLADRTLVGGSA